VSRAAVKLVTAGKLVSYLIGREPVRNFPQSNGHGRAGITGSPRPAIGVLKVTARNGLSDDELNKKLQDLGKVRGLKSVYFVETLAEMRLGCFNQIAPDGKRELVRGAELDDLDQRALRSSVEDAGKDLFTANFFGDVPETVLAPALLLNDVTRAPRLREERKAPVLSAAGLKAIGGVSSRGFSESRLSLELTSWFQLGYFAIQSEGRMNDLNKALGDISSIRRQVAHSTEFRGYGPQPWPAQVRLRLRRPGRRRFGCPIRRITLQPTCLSGSGPPRCRPP